MFNHYGLYFTPADVETARANRRREPFKSAFAALDAIQPEDIIAQVILDGFRYRFNDDDTAAQRAGTQLIERGLGLDVTGLSYVEACGVVVAAGHAFEMLRDRLAQDAARGWLHLYNQQVEALRQQNDEDVLTDIWRAAVEIVAAAVLERDDLLPTGTDDFKRVVENDIHPEGHIPRLVKNSQGDALRRQVLAAKGLALAAEAASHMGVDLWNHEVRGISAKTTAIYAAAYYEYRETWPWDAPPDEEANEQLYRANAGTLEMLNRHLRPVVLRATMSKLRPVFDPYGGGLTTLSHGVAQKRGLFGF